MMESCSVVTIIVHSARNLKAKKKNSHKFLVVFGIGDKKYSTDVVDDPSGCPTWNDQTDIKVDDPTDTLLFVVKEKHSTLGQVAVPIKFVPAKPFRKVTTTPLQPHKKCTDPAGLLVYEAWVTKQEHVIRKDKSPLARLKNQLKSPNLSRVVHSSLKPFRSNGSSLQVKTRLKSVSLTDLSSPVVTIEVPELRKERRSPSLVLGLKGFGPTVNGRAPVIQRVSPIQGSCLGGTLITIEGEHLGNRAQDIIALDICRTDCCESLKYTSSNKLQVTTKPHKPGDGQVIIKTLSGGMGTYTEPFMFVNETLTSQGSKKSSFLEEISPKKDGKYVTLLEEELAKFRTENEELRCINHDMREYIGRLVGRLITEYPDALAVQYDQEQLL